MEKINWIDAKKELPNCNNYCIAVIRFKKTSHTQINVARHDGEEWRFIFLSPDKYEVLYRRLIKDLTPPKGVKIDTD